MAERPDRAGGDESEAPPGADHVAEVVAALLAGQLVLLPTDTVYGLAARPDDPQATDALFAAKGRAGTTPLAVLCTDTEQAVGLADPAVADVLREVGQRWWPGPLTVVVPRRAGVTLHLGEPSTTVGLRVPDHALVRAVAAEVGPIAATSANCHGHATPTTFTGAVEEVGSAVAVAVDGGVLEGAASTVIDATSMPWRVLREGPIRALEILDVAGGAGQ